MAKDYFSKEYQSWIEWVDKRLEKEWSWDRIRMCGKETEEEVQAYLDNQDEIDYHHFSLAEWNEFVDMKKEYEEKSTPIEEMTFSTSVGEDDLDAPKEKNTAWQKYRRHLEGNFPGTAIDQIEKSSRKVLNMLYDGAGDTYKIVHGLVMGNVQSGKTANMEGLMSMAADYGWNMFIVLSGTIENLRQQTRTRFMKDLQNGNLTWDYSIDNPTVKNNPPEVLDLTSRKRYVIVCLKNGARLNRLLRWLNSDKNKKSQMKVLVIDDESDQASINTAKIEENEEATRINRLIKAIVNGNTSEKATTIASYGAMNYIAYTATPYGNFLNEKGEGTLYPADFIHVLPTSDIYFGPTHIFGDIINGTTDGMPIINEITSGSKAPDDKKETDTTIIETINDNWKASKTTAPEIPESLQEAIAWFCICVAVQRYRKSVKPVSMLVHHDMKVEYHTSIAVAIRQWFDNISLDDFMTLCRNVYDKQTNKMSLDSFKMAYRNYGRMSGLNIDEDVRDYPPFDRLLSFIAEIKNTLIHHITMDRNEDLIFDKGIHLCVDNCNYTTIVKDEDEEKMPHVRLVYPKDGDNLDFAPAFLVVGGNTLARGLTLEGLVCTYFSRVVKQADTLMQMGRWFGYRRGYELLPRLWMTESAVEKFEQLAALDEQLRSDIADRYFDKNMTPDQYGPMISTCPMLVKMKITADNKMQGAVSAEVNFAGAHIQSLNYENNDELLQKNLDVADVFLTSLGDGNGIYNKGHEHEFKVWENVPFEKIKMELFMKSKYELPNIDNFEIFCKWFEEKHCDFPNWTVILCGKKNPDNEWHGTGKVERTRLLTGLRTEDSYRFSIGSLAVPAVWDYDLTKDYRDGLTDEQRKLLSGRVKDKADEIKSLKQQIRTEQGKGNVPRLVFYCIDHNSCDVEGNERRAPLNTNTDVLGIEIIIPGKRASTNDYTSAVTINRQTQGEQ